jgi:endonuclease/exonuclease/phosphatase family metal-dependent hydrolase
VHLARLPCRGVPELVVASFNAHAGMDGWGRPYDLAEACRQLSADVIVLQESFAPLEAISQADELASVLGYSAVELPLARAWRRKQGIAGGKRWEPRKLFPNQQRPLRVGGRVTGNEPQLKGYEEGSWGIAVLSKPTVMRTHAIELGRLKRDFTHRGALVVELEVANGASSAATSEGATGLLRSGSGRFTVVGTHAAHIHAGSPLQIRRLHAQLPGGVPAALAGDMNLWGPPLRLMMPGWRRAVRGRTWPAWRPHSQPDHILVNSGVTVEEGDVVRTGDSDHLAVRARLSW